MHRLPQTPAPNVLQIYFIPTEQQSSQVRPTCILCFWHQERGNPQVPWLIHYLPRTLPANVLLINPSSDTYSSSNSDCLLSPLTDLLWSDPTAQHSTQYASHTGASKKMLSSYSQVIYMLRKHRHVLQHKTTSPCSFSCSLFFCSMNPATYQTQRKSKT